MGIVNVTPDSFSGDGVLRKENDTRAALRLARRHILAGADIIDIGGESSRPGAKRISAAEEIRRIIPVIKDLAKIAKIPISVDTYKGETAARALDAGASIINNIQGIKPDKKLLKMAAAYQAGIVIMHMRGIPATMQKKTFYKNPVTDVIREIKFAFQICLENGIKSDKIIIDPGLCFAKSAEQNLEILRRLDEFRIFKRPILIGASRKSFIAKILGKGVQELLTGTLAAGVMAIAKGANILRVHDVKAMSRAAIMADAIKNCNLTRTI